MVERGDRFVILDFKRLNNWHNCCGLIGWIYRWQKNLQISSTPKSYCPKSLLHHFTLECAHALTFTHSSTHLHLLTHTPTHSYTLAHELAHTRIHSHTHTCSNTITHTNTRPCMLAQMLPFLTQVGTRCSRSWMKWKETQKILKTWLIYKKLVFNPLAQLNFWSNNVACVRDCQCSIEHAHSTDRTGRGASWHWGSVCASHLAAPGLNLNTPKKIPYDFFSQVLWKAP